MSSTQWNAGLNGSWTVGANWSAGVPNTGTDATINAFGTYTVTLAGTGFASSLTINSAGAIFSETPAGSLDIVHALTLNTGKAILKSANTIGSVVQAGGVLETANNSALGDGTYTFQGGELLGLSNESFTNQLTMSGNLTFAAAHGTALTENATNWSFDATTPGSIRFGQGGNDGTIVWLTNSGSVTNPGHVSTEIATGTFKAGDDTWGFLFQNASQTLIDATGTLDIAGFTGFVNNLQGTGSIVDSGGAATMSVFGGGNFGGVISGGLLLDVSSGTLVVTNANTYSGGTQIDLGAELQLGNGGTTGAIAGDVVDNGTLAYDRSNALTITANISGTGGVAYEGGGGVTINRAENYSAGTSVIGDTVTTNNAAAFGSGQVTLSNSSLIGTAAMTMTISNLVLTGGSSTIAAAHGRVLTPVASGQSWALDASSGSGTLNIGDAVNNGTVIWNTGAGSTVIGLSTAHVEVHGGAFTAGDDSFAFLLENVADVTVDAGALLDLGTFGTAISGLQGAGSVIDRANATIEIAEGDFSGVISGAASVLIEDGVVLTGANTYTKGTTIDSASALSLGDGGTTGSVVGNIVDNGVLILNHSDNLTETVAITGTGQLNLLGSGTVTIDRAETYSGGTNLGAGELSIDRAQAIGTGNLVLNGGEFLTTATAVLGNRLLMSGEVTISAATGTQLNFNAAAGWALDATNTTDIVFGDGTNNGSILFHTPAGSSVTNTEHYTVRIHSDVLKAGDSSLGFLLDNTSATTIDSGGALNVNGFSIDVANLLGSGTITNTGAATTFDIETGTFSGTINGALTQVQTFGTVSLSGGGAFAGEFKIEPGSTLALAAAWSQNVEFASPGILSLVTPGQYTGHVVNYAAGDQVDIRGVDFNKPAFAETYDSGTGRVTVTDGTHTFHVTFDGSYVLGNFVASSDSHGGTNLTFAPSEIHPSDIHGPMLASDYPDATLF